MKKIALCAAVVAFVAGSSTAYALSLQLVNESRWDIHELYFSQDEEAEWGPDQLGDEVIASGESFTLTKIARGMYDVRIVDEDGDTCDVGEVDFSESESFALTDAVLVGCQMATAEENEE